MKCDHCDKTLNDYPTSSIVWCLPCIKENVDVLVNAGIRFGGEQGNMARFNIDRYMSGCVYWSEDNNVVIVKRIPKLKKYCIRRLRCLAK